MDQLKLNGNFDLVFDHENGEINLLSLNGSQYLYADDSVELFILRKHNIEMTKSGRKYLISKNLIDRFFEDISLADKYTIIEEDNYYYLQFGNSTIEICLTDQSKRNKIYVNHHVHKILTLAKVELEPFLDDDKFTFISQKWIFENTLKKEIAPHTLFIDDTGEVMIQTPTQRYYVMNADFVAYKYTYLREIDEMKNDGLLFSKNLDGSISVSSSFFSLLGNNALTEKFKLMDSGDKIYYKKGRMKLSLLDTYQKDSLQHKILLKLGVIFNTSEQKVSICKTFLSKIVYQRVQNYIDKSIIQNLLEPSSNISS